ncbi:MAG: NAD-dependent epimerase/dehydratase family protein [Candidatus Eisenbacteria bacterium]
MRILVVGGTRFIGAATVRRLHKLGHDIAVLNRGQSPATPPEGVRQIRGDRARLGDSRSEILDFAPDVALHTVIISDRDAEIARDAFRGIASRWVMLSSCDVYRAYGRLTGTEPGAPDPLPLTETSPLREQRFPYRNQFPDPQHPLHIYDKIPAEEIALGDSELQGTVLRLPMVLGPNDYQHRLFPFLKRMDDGRPSIILEEGYADWRSTYGFVENVAECIAKACVDERAAGEIYNVADWDLSMEELVGAVGKATGWSGTIVRMPSDALPEAMRSGVDTTQNLVISAEKIRRDLDIRPSASLDETIRVTTEWERSNPPSPIPDGQFDYEAEDQLLARS